MSDIIEEKEIPVEEECDEDETDTDMGNKDKIISNLKAAGVIIEEEEASS
jgi:hypothetical protein